MKSLSSVESPPESNMSKSISLDIFRFLVVFEGGKEVGRGGKGFGLEREGD